MAEDPVPITGTDQNITEQKMNQIQPIGIQDIYGSPEMLPGLE